MLLTLFTNTDSSFSGGKGGFHPCLLFRWSSLHLLHVLVFSISLLLPYLVKSSLRRPKTPFSSIILFPRSFMRLSHVKRISTEESSSSSSFRVILLLAIFVRFSFLFFHSRTRKTGVAKQTELLCIPPGHERRKLCVCVRLSKCRPH